MEILVGTIMAVVIAHFYTALGRSAYVDTSLVNQTVFCVLGYKGNSGAVTNMQRAPDFFPPYNQTMLRPLSSTKKSVFFLQNTQKGSREAYDATPASQSSSSNRSGVASCCLFDL
ncbi:hypothetical protein FN846DRAFT_695934 [Sphaerosporella brunnea]|uniref:Uncharacterized protein n=1 Tax=Sphaerosporella brunnea TaxID=1250544 RepID=A0A5J5EXU4_9PEZI|nr:hypothetical protein FN846DRAFT_695934 [Sphaerosporella brunnea]